ncbi:MAG: hypothetical protein ACETV1_08340, partial [Candidatus Bathyarchaeia archaeon]
NTLRRYPETHIADMAVQDVTPFPWEWVILAIILVITLVASIRIYPILLRKRKRTPSSVNLPIEEIRF